MRTIHITSQTSDSRRRSNRPIWSTRIAASWYAPPADGARRVAVRLAEGGGVVAKDLRIRSIPIPSDLTEDETKRLVVFAIEKGAQDPVTTGGRLEWHLDSHWNPRESLVLAELRRIRRGA
jgi:hypothetical protein